MYKYGYEVLEQLVRVDKLSKRNNNELNKYSEAVFENIKHIVALGQTYFAVQTRKQELTEKEYSMLTEDEKRF